MQDNIVDSRLLLGWAGWPHPQWQGGYFPEDLPADWQFAYYSNDADCLLLSAAQWQALDAGLIGDWLEDAPEHFRFYLEMPAGTPDIAALSPFEGHIGGLLVEKFHPLGSELPQFCRVDEGYWADAQGRARLWRWDHLPSDLRQQRTRLEQMPATVQALILSDPQADPRALADTRTLAELLGVA